MTIQLLRTVDYDVAMAFALAAGAFGFLCGVIVTLITTNKSWRF